MKAVTAEGSWIVTAGEQSPTGGPLNTVFGERGQEESDEKSEESSLAPQSPCFSRRVKEPSSCGQYRMKDHGEKIKEASKVTPLSFSR
jgi:hypothetical protein